MLLSRPTEPRTETVNDKDCYLANFWRAVQADPHGVAEHCGWLLAECDIEARRKWVFDAPERAEFRARMYAEHDYFDAELAGWWVWGVCATIGGNWKPRSMHLGAGRGVHKPSMHLGDAGRGVHTYMQRLAERISRVRVKCGDWTGVTSPTVTHQPGITAVLLDPPYDSDCDTAVYQHNDSIGTAVREWAIANGDHPQMRIALCGYEGEHEMPPDWECLAWKTKGGYGSQSDGQGRENAHRERVWFSPHCLSVTRELQQELSL